jgi:hypothetical protein
MTFLGTFWKFLHPGGFFASGFLSSSVLSFDLGHPSHPFTRAYVSLLRLAQLRILWKRSASVRFRSL